MTASTRGLTITTSLDLVTEDCACCGAMPSDLQAELIRAKSGRSFYCPNGHSQSYVGKTDAQKAQEERERAEQLARMLDARTRDLEQERRSHTATKGQLTRARKQVDRAVRGVCPCCNRSFVNVRRHVESKHPERLPDLERALP